MMIMKSLKKLLITVIGFCQIQLNYIDTDIQAGMKGYKLTEEKNVPLVIMEQLKVEL